MGNNAGVYIEDTRNLQHSPILGWAYDGFPVYGPYGFDNPSVDSTDAVVRRMRTGFVPRDGTHGTVNLAETGRSSLAKWAAELRELPTTETSYTITDSSKHGPDVDDTYLIGYWIEDHAYLGDLGYAQGVDFDLDVYNGRFCRTPEYPEGTYAYFVTIDEESQPIFPYAIGRQWFGEVSGGRVQEIAEETSVFIEAGPASATQLTGINVSPSDQMVTLTWSSIEGGQYNISSSSDLETWTAQSEATEGSPIKTETSIPFGNSPHQFYAVSLESIADYDSEGSAGTGMGGPGMPGGGGPGGGGAEAGTGNPSDGYVFSFNGMPPEQNLAQNLQVGNIPATVVAYQSFGPQGGTITLSFDDREIASGISVSATFSHQPPGRGTVVETSTNTFTKP